MSNNYQRTTLKNGIRLVSERMPQGRAVSVGVWVCAGSRNEAKKQNGISHLLEHMVFKGTKSRTAYEIATSLESLGGHLNAFTEREYTCFYAFVLDENLSQAVDVLADLVQNAVLNEHDLQNERRIVFEEIRNLQDSPDDYILDIFIRMACADHPLGRSILGSYESLGKITKQDLMEYRKTYYTPDNIVVSAAGNVDHVHLMDLVNAHFSSDSKVLASQTPPITPGKERFQKVHLPVNQVHICTGAFAYSYKDARKFPLLVLNALLGGGMSSRLFQNLREKKGLAYSIYSFADLWSDTGLFGVYAGISPKNTEEVLSLISEELVRLSDSPVAEEELQRIKSQLKGNFILSSEDCQSRMNRIAKMEMYTQQYMTLDEAIDAVESVTQEDIQTIAYDIFKERKQYTTIIEPSQSR